MTTIATKKAEKTGFLEFDNEFSSKIELDAPFPALQSERERERARFVLDRHFPQIRLCFTTQMH